MDSKQQCCVYDDCQEDNIRYNNFLIKCSSSNNLVIPVGTTSEITYTLVALDLDLGHFCNPMVNLEFISNILSPISFAELNFQIFRQCKGELSPVAVSSIWTFNTLTPGVNSSTFTFNSCDCNLNYCGCCTYTVVVTVTSAVATNPTTINNAKLDIFVTESYSRL